MVRFVAALLVAACLFCGVAFAVEEPQTDNPDPFAEFWHNIMKNPFKDTGTFDPNTTFGYMMENLELGGYLRLRYESTELRPIPKVFGPSPVFPGGADLAQYGDDWGDWVSERAQFYITIPITPDLRFRGEAINLNVLGDKARFRATPAGDLPSVPSRDPAITDPEIQLYQGFGEWDNFITRGLGAKVGRQEINYGEGWIISDQPFYSGFTFDAAKVQVKTEQATIDFIAAEVSTIYKPQGPSYPRIYGAYCTYAAEESTNFDFFGFFNNDEMNQQDNGIKADFVDESRWTLGSRLHGNILSDVDYDLNTAYQLGHTGPSATALHEQDDVSAYALQGGIGKTFQEAPWTPRIGGKAAYASGDKDPDNTKNHAYNPLYRNLHALNGYADAVKFSNLIDYALEGSVKPYDRITIGTEGHVFFFADRPANLSNKLAKELDFFTKVKASENLSFEVAYAMFVQDRAFRDATGDRQHNQRVYFQLEYAF